MISKTTLTSSSDAARYHDSALVEDAQAVRKEADNYYANETAIATWEGAGARILGIEGSAVNKTDFVNFLEGKIQNPSTGMVQDLAANSKGAERRLGYDFTISAPKSVSVVALVGNDSRIVAAHVSANKAAMSWLERNGAQVRVKNGTGTVNSENLLYATVQHETSRANDPQLHNHNVIVAVSYDKEGGAWRSLTNDELFKLRASADNIYKNELARGLKAIGYGIEYAEDGKNFEISGVSKELLTTFSERTTQIAEALKLRGIDPGTASYEARQAAALDSRASKNDLGKETLQGIWQDKAKEVGLNLSDLVAEAKDRAIETADYLNQSRAAANKSVSYAIEHLAEREQSFKVADLEIAAIYLGGGDVSIQDVHVAITERLSDRSLVDREDSKVKMVTTSAAIAEELTLHNSIVEGKGRGKRIITEITEFEQAVKIFEERKSKEIGGVYKLSGEQVNAAKNVLMHPDKFQGIQGDAGTGKTAALEFVQEVAAGQGWQTLGLATSTTGVTELQSATGIPSITVAAFMVQKDRQLNLLQSELDVLTVTIANSSENQSRIKQIEKRDLNLNGIEGQSGTARYVFDNKTGRVFKSSIGPLNPLNVVGHKLLDAAYNSNEWDRSWRDGESFADKFKVGASTLRAVIQERVGRSLAGYELVGTVEAKKARQMHETRGLIEHNDRLKAFQAKTAQVENLHRTGNIDGKKLMFVMDEASMTGTRDSAKISEISRELGARIIIQGDTKQHGSVAAGQALQQTHESGINLSKIEETRRFDKATPQTKQAIVEMKKGNYSGALAGLDTTNVALEDNLYFAAAERYVTNLKELVAQGDKDPKIAIVALSNNDRKLLNIYVRSALQEDGFLDRQEFRKQHLDDPKLTKVEQQYVPALESKGVDRLTALRDYKSLGIQKEEILKVVDFKRETNTIVLMRENGVILSINPRRHVHFSVAVSESRQYSLRDKVEARANIGRKDDPNRITNGTRGIIVGVNNTETKIEWQDGRKTVFTNEQMHHVDHAYTHTSYKEQGVSNQREIFVVSETGAKIINKLAAYVAASRAKGNTEIVTNSRELMLKNAGNTSEKTTAIDIGKLGDQLSIPDSQLNNSQNSLTNDRPSQSIKPAVSQDLGLGI